MTSNHVWKFFRAGGFDQVKIESGLDIANLDQLDQKLWVALACPTNGLEFDARTLALVDSDNDGRIRVPELIAAAKWTTSLLKNPDDLLTSSSSLPLSAINEMTPEGKRLAASARQILTNLGKMDATAITLEDTADTAKIFAQTNFNGDGIVPIDAATDEATKAVITDIMACCGVETDRSGKPGISQAKADQFFAEAQAYSDWWQKAQGNTAILPLGEATAVAFAAVQAVKLKVDDYFARVRLAEFDPRALAALNRQETEYLVIAAQDLTITSKEVLDFPAARIEAGKAMPLKTGVNPAWAAGLSLLQTLAVQPLLGDKSSLTEADWAALNARFAAFENWSTGKVGATVEKIGLTRVREILAGKAKETINALIAQDKALEAEAGAIDGVDKLVHFYRDLYLLCTNFVNFKDFYDRGEPASFQVGRLYLDQRSCDLVLSVEDVAKHAMMAGLAGAYLAYCDCVRKSTGEKRQIVAAFTNGDSDNLMVGRNGIFYDRKGQDWDATITKLIDNPISIRQAFWLPYKKLVRMIEEQVAKRAAAADAAATAKLQDAAALAANADATTSAAPKKIDVGTVAALGVAFGAISTAAAALATGIVKLALWQIFLLPVALVLIISGPSMILAFIKLRKRNLGPILDANGWAVNAKAKINVPFGKSLTQVAALPAGSQRDLHDPFADKKNPWPKIIIGLILFGVMGGCWYFGKLDQWIPPQARSIEVLGTNAPTYALPAALSTNLPPK